jgi:hypothetical protein
MAHGQWEMGRILTICHGPFPISHQAGFFSGLLTRRVRMTTYTVGVFQDLAWARRGIDALMAQGFEAESLALLVKSSHEAEALIQTKFGREPDRLDVARLGAILATGPLIATLQGNDRALHTAGVAGSFRRAGFQAHDGQIFENLLSRGGVLVGISNERRAADALATLHAYGGGNAAIGAWAGRV